MKNIFLIFTLLFIISFQASAQDAQAKARAFERGISVEAGGIYSQLLGGKTYTQEGKLAGGYGYFAKIHARLKGFNYLGVTLGWGWQIWEHTEQDSLKHNISTYAGGGTWSLGVKYYPLRRVYIGFDATLNNLRLKPTSAAANTTSSQVGAKVSINKEFFIARYPLEIGLAGLVMLPREYPKLYGVNLTLSTRI